MRRDFRVKIDFSKIYFDARRFSWVFVDSSRILYVHELADHIQKLFDLEKPFHLLSKFEETHCFLPFDEDVRILENNDTVLIVPGTGFVKSAQNGESSTQNSTHNTLQNGFKEPINYSKINNIGDSEISYPSEKSSIHNTLETTSDTVSMSETFYRTALHETATNDEDLKTTDDNFTEDTSVTEDILTSKKKRIRKRPKRKKQMSTTAECDASPIEPSLKKPKIIDSILIPSGKHIRFKGVEDGDKMMDGDVLPENNEIQQNGRGGFRPDIAKDLNALLSLRKSSTPLTFTHKRVMKDFKPEVIDESRMSTESNNDTNQPNSSATSNKSASNPTKHHENSESKLSDILNSTITFKVFRIGEDYTPQLSDFILAQVLGYNRDESKYTLKIIEGLEQLQDPYGKFSLPKDDDNDDEDETNDVLVLESSKLIDLKPVKALNQ
ncbi:hypothetical protein QAD02_017179 [Eretmocerus hayati]|uniref:Uncharacterized protein n=1 Tax=Eretmocerus hayati TaxID=131215 RepID=A0ACC2PD64_9HYME|nr:hypothetical protein QAD02_017179 [Eretmocerus hayati]